MDKITVNMDNIKEFSIDLAKEITERSMYDIEGIALLIGVKIKNNFADLIKDRITRDEREYQLLLEQQAKNRLGSSEYIKLGYKLAAAKHKKASSNRILNETKKETKYLELRKFVISTYGEDFFGKFLEQAKDKDLFKDEITNPNYEYISVKESINKK